MVIVNKREPHTSINRTVEGATVAKKDACFGLDKKMVNLKPISPESVSTALGKADRYRVLNEPELAESICLDILNVEAENQNALMLLIHSCVDQFTDGNSKVVARAREVLSRLSDACQREYFGGVIWQAQGRSLLGRRGGQANHVAYEMLRFAMEQYGKAMKLRPEDMLDASLRQNACVRLIKCHGLTAAPPDDPRELDLE
jgi:hypothetical protein